LSVLARLIFSARQHAESAYVIVRLSVRPSITRAISQKLLKLGSCNFQSLVVNFTPKFRREHRQRGRRMREW